MYSLTRSICRALTADVAPDVATERLARGARDFGRCAVELGLSLPCDASTRKDDSSQNMRLRSWKACSILMSRFTLGRPLSVNGKYGDR